MKMSDDEILQRARLATIARSGLSPEGIQDILSGNADNDVCVQSAREALTQLKESLESLSYYFLVDTYDWIGVHFEHRSTAAMEAQ